MREPAQKPAGTRNLGLLDADWANTDAFGGRIPLNSLDLLQTYPGGIGFDSLCRGIRAFCPQPMSKRQVISVSALRSNDGASDKKLPQLPPLRAAR